MFIAYLCLCFINLRSPILRFLIISSDKRDLKPTKILLKRKLENLPRNLAVRPIWHTSSILTIDVRTTFDVGMWGSFEELDTSAHRNALS